MTRGNVRVGITGVIEDVEWTAEATKKMQGRRDALGIRDEAYSAASNGRVDWTTILNAALHDGKFKELDDKGKEQVQLQKFIGEQFDKISQTLTKGVTMAFDVVEDIYKEMKKASPLLQTLESLFNLAMQLFFMPLGNKLAEVLLPAVISLVETAAKLWDELGDGNLSQMLAKAIEYGIKAISGFFKDIGGTLKEQGGLIGSVGNLLESIGKFIEGPMVGVINTILKMTTFVVDNLKLVIAAIIAFKVASIAMNLASTLAIIASNTKVAGTSVGGEVLGAGMVAATAAGLLAGGVAYGYMASQGMADGGMVPHTPGGRLITVAENEDEYIVPKSKMGTGGNVTNNFYGYTSDDIKEMINRSVSEKVSASHIKGGY